MYTKTEIKGRPRDKGRQRGRETETDTKRNTHTHRGRHQCKVRNAKRFPERKKSGFCFDTAFKPSYLLRSTIIFLWEVGGIHAP